MKRMIILAALGAFFLNFSPVKAMSDSQMRNEAFFLTDKMAYELKLNTSQMNDVFEINYDFIYSINHIMANVLRGDTWAINSYYTLLDRRNEDLRWVLNAMQYHRFLNAVYFFRPVYTAQNKWLFRIHITYSNHNHYYYSRPAHFHTHSFQHGRTPSNDRSYYSGRYTHKVYANRHTVTSQKNYDNGKNRDFERVISGTEKNKHRIENNRKQSNKTSQSEPKQQQVHKNAQRSRPSVSPSNKERNTVNRPQTSGSDRKRATNSHQPGMD